MSFVKNRVLLVFALAALLCVMVTGCGNSNETQSEEQTHASDSETIFATSEAENEEKSEPIQEDAEMTKVTLTIGDVVIPATLNSTVAAQEFIKKLPFTVKASKGEFDYCGMGGDLKYDRNETQAGWKNGDIGYARGWFALFHGGEDQSSSYTSEMIIGHIDDEYMETVKNLPGSVTIVVELAE